MTTTKTDLPPLHHWELTSHVKRNSILTQGSLDTAMDAATAKEFTSHKSAESAN